MMSYPILYSRAGDGGDVAASAAGGGTSAAAGSPAPVAGASAGDAGASSAAAAAPAWHEALVTRGADGSERLNDPAQWLDKAPAPFAEFIRANMTAARQKAAATEGMVRVPGKDAKPEEWEAFRAAIGVPKDPSEYDTGIPEKLPDGVTFDQAKAKEFAGFAREIGLTKEQVARIKEYQVTSVGRTAAEARAANEAAMQATLAKERSEMGRRFGGNIDGTVEAAKSLLYRSGVPDALKTVIKGGGFDPKAPGFWGADALEFAAWVAKATGEGSHQGGAPGGLSGREYARSASTDPNHPDYGRFQAGDADVVARVREGYRMV